MVSLKGRHMAELQLVARDGYKGGLGSRNPSSGHEPITSSTLPIRIHPGHGNSPQAPSALVSAPLICVDLIGISHGTGSARTSESATISNSHPQAKEAVAHSPPSIFGDQMNGKSGEDGWHLLGRKQIPQKCFYRQLC